MAKKLSVGDKVQCRYYNTPSGKFYGDLWTATIIEVNDRIRFPYLVQKEDVNLPPVWLARTEIKRRIS